MVEDLYFQVVNSIRTKQDLIDCFGTSLSNDELGAFGKNPNLPIAITPYYADLIKKNPILRKTMVPRIQEFTISKHEEIDPLHEESQSPCEGIVHRYPDRVLFLTTSVCFSYCRYCTRSRVAGHKNNIDIDECLNYIRGNSKIRDVLLSGGDPLTMTPNQLSYILTKLKQIPHVEIVRIGTKAPIVAPQAITEELIEVLKIYKPLLINIHITHPSEFTEQSITAISMMADAGIMLGSQTVLLKDVNDNAETIKELMHLCVKNRVKPYYLYQCDHINGSQHFRTSVEKGISIIHELRGHTSGFCVPTYVIDAPKGGGKIPMMPNYVKHIDGLRVNMKNHEGKDYTYFI